MKKRAISILLALSIALSLLPGQAWATEGEETVPPLVDSKTIESPPEEADGETKATPAIFPEFADEAEGVSLLAVTSGTCGDGLIWKLDGGTLTISGSGPMNGYSSFTKVPWYDARTSITTVRFDGTVTSIGSYAFYECSSLTSIAIPDSVTSIGEQAFSRCSSLNSATIPNSVTSIDQFAFSFCSNLYSVAIPTGVTSIKGGTFEGCSGLTSVTIPNSVTSIAFTAFSRCSSLTSVTIPESVASIDDNAFRNCASLASITVDPVNYRYCDIDGVLFNKNATELYTYPAGRSAAAYTIPDSVTSIGANAFSYCTNLTSVIIPDSVTNIGASAFSGCMGLSSIIIPDSVTSIGDFAFDDCASLSSVTISSSVTSIGHSVFGDCSGLISVIIPNSVTSIGAYAFSGCKNLTSVTIPESVTSISNDAFGNCSSLTNVTIPEGVISISGSTFENCGKLATVAIPRSVASIGYDAFSGCRSLKTVYYMGDENQWGKISIGSGNYCLTSATIYYNSTGPFIGFEWNSYKIEVGETRRIGLMLPDDITESQLTVSVNKGELIEIGHNLDKGYLDVRGLKPGEATITVSTEDGRSASCKIIVSGNTAEISDIKFTGCIESFYGSFTVSGNYHKNLEGSVEIRDYQTDQCLYQKTAKYFELFDCTYYEDVDETQVNFIFSKVGGFTYLCNQKIYFYSADFIRNENDETLDFLDLKDKFSLKMEPDRWSFINANENFLPELLLMQGELDYFREHPNKKERRRIFDHYGETWNGSCYGMSALTVLVAADKVTANQIDPYHKANLLYDMEKIPSDRLESIINYVQFIQYLDGHHNFQENFMLLSTEQQLRIVENLAEIAENGGSPFILGYGTAKEGHCVVGYGIERGSFTEYINPESYPGLPTVGGMNVSFDSRVRIYNCSDIGVTVREKSYLYFNSGSNLFYIPAAGGICHLMFAYSNTALMDPQGYLTNVIATPSKAERSSLIVTSSNGKFGFTLELNGKTYHVDEFTDERTAGIVSYFDDMKYIQGEPRTMYVTLPDAEVDCTIIPDSGTSCEYALNTPDALFSYEAKDVTSIRMTSAGEIQANGAGGNYRYMICYNDGIKGLPWHTMDISGKAESDLQIFPQESGISISGQMAGDVMLICEDNTSATTANFTVGESTALMVSALNEDSPAVYTDTDNDGTFESALEIQISKDVVLVTDWSVEEGFTTVTISDPGGLLWNDSIIYAVQYDTGRMTRIETGKFYGRSVKFPAELSEGWVLFFLDSKYVPIIPKVELCEVSPVLRTSKGVQVQKLESQRGNR